MYLLSAVLLVSPGLIILSRERATVDKNVRLSWRFKPNDSTSCAWCRGQPYCNLIALGGPFKHARKGRPGVIRLIEV